MDNVETTFVRIPYPEGFFSDGRESNWYTNPESKRVYKRVKVGESFRFVEQIHNIPSFVFDMITAEHQEECRIHSTIIRLRIGLVVVYVCNFAHIAKQ